MQEEASLATPFMPKNTARVYTTQITTKMAMVRKLDSGIPVTVLMAMDNSGVAREKVVAVPARRANTAIRSITFPQGPSTFFPSKGLQASEYFCLLRRRTWIIKPKATAITI